jgi:hypothetical protein
MMDRTDLEHDDPSPRVRDSFEGASPQTDLAWLGEIVKQLEEDPQECWPAMEGLAALDPALREAMVAELSNYREKPGVGTLLRLLSAARDPSLRSAARMALPGRDGEPTAIARQDGDGTGDAVGSGRPSAPLPARLPHAGRELDIASRREDGLLDGLGMPIVRALVTPVDGRGRGTIVVSSRRSGQRRTAAFWCDVRRGILDVLGDVEPDTPSAGRLLDDWIEQSRGDCVCDDPSVAVLLLGGSLWLCGEAVPDTVRDWLDGTLGPTFGPSGLAGILPGMEQEVIPDEELAARANAVLDACPSWLDRSPLTFELAEEISLREGPSAPDPDRDSGAYRFLFEHLLIHRLELYRRMLFWMAWVWQGSGWAELARSACALACQLSDEQYEVPSHPFTVALSTRSLEAAQARLRTAEDPRSPDHRPSA